MGGGRGADAAFEHGAAVQADAVQAGHRRHIARRQQAAGLGDLDRVHIGGIGAGQRHGRVRTVQCFVSHDGNVEALLEARQRGDVGGTDRLLDQVHAARFQCGDTAQRIHFAPGLVDVDPYAGALAQRALDGQHVGHVGQHIAQADLQLEDAVAAQFQHLFGLGDVLGGIAAGQSPRHWQFVAHPAAQQFRQRHMQAARLRVQQGGFDGALGEAVALYRLAQLGHDLRHLAGFRAQQQRREIGVDVGLDAFRALFAVVQPADGGGFAPAGDAVGA